MTLNKATGNISIGGFTSGGAQSVNVSLSGTTLTVNVDGHSDSVNLSSISNPTALLSLNSVTVHPSNFTGSSYSNTNNLNNRISSNTYVTTQGNVALNVKQYQLNSTMTEYSYRVYTDRTDTTISTAKDTLSLNYNLDCPSNVYGSISVSCNTSLIAQLSTMRCATISLNDAKFEFTILNGEVESYSATMDCFTMYAPSSLTDYTCYFRSGTYNFEHNLTI